MYLYNDNFIVHTCELVKYQKNNLNVYQNRDLNRRRLTSKRFKEKNVFSLSINFQISQIFRTLFKINTLTEKKVLSWIFLFFNGFSQTPTPHPLNDQNSLVTKNVFWRCILRWW